VQAVKLIGITGGVGMGKSTAHSILVTRSIPVVDTDELARILVEPGQRALAEIQSQFGSEVIAPDGTLRREVLAKQIFRDEAARTRLEAILHPRIRRAWESEVNTWRVNGLQLGAVVIPLLFETQAQDSFDTVVCIACSPGTQWERLKQRGWTESDRRQRIAAQWPIERKMEASDHVIWTEGDLRCHAEQWERILPLPSSDK
jgi:dephospho-CoA kinase